tara:strand:+ start:450 stop:767 length:318 start_codon:yes stop_codon:yes gene_type:complete
LTLLEKIALSPLMVSLPALATITAIYGRTTAPKSANQRYGLGKITARIKHKVRIIIEIKYFLARDDWSFESGWPTLEIDADIVFLEFSGVMSMAQLYAGKAEISL